MYGNHQNNVWMRISKLTPLTYLFLPNIRPDCSNTEHQKEYQATQAKYNKRWNHMQILVWTMSPLAQHGVQTPKMSCYRTWPVFSLAVSNRLLCWSSGLSNNYCRNPDNAPEGALYYTTNPGKHWHYCSVPKFVSVRASEEHPCCNPTFQSTGDGTWGSEKCTGTTKTMCECMSQNSQPWPIFSDPFAIHSYLQQ